MILLRDDTGEGHVIDQEMFHVTNLFFSNLIISFLR